MTNNILALSEAVWRRREEREAKDTDTEHFSHTELDAEEQAKILKRHRQQKGI